MAINTTLCSSNSLAMKVIPTSIIQLPSWTDFGGANALNLIGLWGDGQGRFLSKISSKDSLH